MCSLDDIIALVINWSEKIQRSTESVAYTRLYFEAKNCLKWAPRV